MFAVIKAKGYQYVVSQGDRIVIPARFAQVGETVEFKDVLMIKDNGNTAVGMPFLKGAIVHAKVTKTGKLPKQIVYKFRRRKKYRRKAGHKQDFCEVEITAIEQGKEK
jgi:large subunit ribosomal protein L21